MLFLADFSVIGPSPALSYVSFAMVVFLALAAILVLIALMDLFLRDFEDHTQRIFWLLAIVLTGPLGSAFYLVRGRRLAFGRSGSLTSLTLAAAGGRIFRLDGVLALQ